MRQTEEFIKYRDRVKNCVSFFRMFGRVSNGKLIATNLYCKLSGHWINERRNDKLNKIQVQKLEKKLIQLRDYINEWIKHIQENQKP